MQLTAVWSSEQPMPLLDPAEHRLDGWPWFHQPEMCRAAPVRQTCPLASERLEVQSRHSLNQHSDYL